jgi:allantoin racemase
VKTIAVTYPVPEDIVSPGFEVEVVYPMHHGVYGAPYSSVDYKVLELGNLEAGMRAEKAGADAFFMNSGGDYGIADLRDNLTIPVVGGMQAAMLAAANLGPRYSIVTIWPEEVNHIHHRQLSWYGMESRCVSIRNTVRFDEVDGEVPHRRMVDRMQSGADEIVDRILSEIDQAVRVDRADSVVLGCTCMHPIAPLLASRTPVPVIDGTTVGYRMAELMLASGLRPKQPPRGSKLLERGLLVAALAAARAAPTGPDDPAGGDACEVLGSVQPGLTSAVAG